MDNNRTNYNYNYNYEEDRGGKGLVIGIVVATVSVIAAAVVVILLLTGTIGGRRRVESARTTSFSTASSRGSSGGGSLRSRIENQRNSSSGASASVRSEEEKEEEEETPADPMEEISGYYIATTMDLGDTVLDEAALLERGIDLHMAFGADGTGWMTDTFDGRLSVKSLTWDADSYKVAGYPERPFTYENGVIRVSQEGVGHIELTRQEGEIPEKPEAEPYADTDIAIGNVIDGTEIRVRIRPAESSAAWDALPSTHELPDGTMTSAHLSDIGSDPGVYDVQMEIVTPAGGVYVYRGVEIKGGDSLMFHAEKDTQGNLKTPTLGIFVKIDGEYEITAQYEAE